MVSLQNLGLPVVCEKDGPFSVSFGKSLLQPLGLQLCLHSLSFVPDGKYIVHDENNMHFFALVVREGFVQTLDDAAVVQISLSTLTIMLSDTNFTFYKCCTPKPLPDSQKNVFGGAGVLAKNVYKTHVQSCHCGHRSFSTGHDIPAVVYSLGGERTTTVRTMRCNGYQCRTTFGPNFFVENGKKINTAGPDDLGDVLFINMRKPASLWTT